MSNFNIILAAWIVIVVLLLLLVLAIIELLNERVRRKAAEDLSMRALDAMVAGKDVRIRRGQA